MIGITLKGTRVYEEAREEEATNIIFRQLKKRLGQELSEEMRARVESLSLPTLENLGEALLDFTSLTDLQAWLEAQ